MLAQPDASGEATIKNVLPNWIRTTPFLRAGHGCQHMKVNFDPCHFLDPPLNDLFRSLCW